MPIQLSEVVDYLDSYLSVREVSDWPNALNGLQVESDRDLAHLNELEQRYPEAAKPKWTELRTRVGIKAVQERLEELSKTAVDVEIRSSRHRPPAWSAWRSN